MPFEVDSTWIQKGELGIAFLMVLLCASIVIYVLRTSAERETKLMLLVERYQDALDKSLDGFEDLYRGISDMKNEVHNGMSDMHERLLVIESKISTKARAAKAKK